ncbi:hypothetical protein HYC85_028647 [Camellia sinensis]|uniref:Uncharacterized protein n=1 Tax=Camellia sinensis TaxID=4442 RepID=A0A7J7FZQ7_CAMSI|nr:hypothetical protein HYC85_028647 [Camellia sinensis]
MQRDTWHLQPSGLRQNIPCDPLGHMSSLYLATWCSLGTKEKPINKTHFQRFNKRNFGDLGEMLPNLVLPRTFS